MRPIPVQAPRNGHGWTIQARIFVVRGRLELIARSSAIRRPRAGATSLARVDEAAAGFNVYLRGDVFKVQLDYVNARGAGVLTGRSDAARVQVQLTF